MKGPTYILKKSYIEHEEKREYKLHMEKLKQIQGIQIKGGLMRSISVDRKFVDDKEQKRIQNRARIEEEQKRVQKLENKALISKLDEIYKGKYSIMREINDKTYKESVQYLSSIQNIKQGRNISPTQRKRIRTITNNEQSNNSNAYKQQTYKDYLDDQSAISIQQNDTRGRDFFKIYSQNTKGDNSQRRLRSEQSQSHIGKLNNENTENQNQFGNGLNKDNSIKNKSNQNFNPNNTHGTNINNDDKDPNVKQQNDNESNSNIQNSDVQKDDQLKNNKQHQQPNPHIYGIKRGNSQKLIKTECNLYENNQSDHNIQQGTNQNQNNSIYDNEYGNQNGNIDNHRNQKSQDRKKSPTKEEMRRRINSSINLASLNKNISASLERLKQQERIQIENNKIVQRILNLPSVIPTKSVMKKEQQKQEQLMKQISKFHEYKERKMHNYLSNRKDLYDSNNIGLQDGIPLDENNQELMDQRVHLVIKVKEIAFINFLPISTDMEKYFMEIQASVHEIRRTNPEVYKDFSKSVINEFFYLKELKQSRIMYMGIYKWTPVDNGYHFLGDFEIDLTPYYLQSGVHQIHYELRNYKQMHNLPNYMVKDMRKKGLIDIEISIKSSIKEYLLDQDIIKIEDFPHYDSNFQQENVWGENPAEKKKNSESSLIQLYNLNQIQQTKKQQSLKQQYLQVYSSKEFHKNKNINKGKKPIPSLLQSNNTKTKQSPQRLKKNVNQNKNNNEIDYSKNQIIDSVDKQNKSQQSQREEQFQKDQPSHQSHENQNDQYLLQDKDEANQSKQDQNQQDIQDEIEL